MSNNNLPTNPGNGKINPVAAAGNIFSARNTALKPTHYTTRVTTLNPCAFVLLIDQSGSMAQEIEDNKGGKQTKANLLSMTVNKFLDEIILTCQKTDLIKDYFQILIIGYGRVENDDSVVKVAWEGPLNDKTWVSVNELRSNSKRKEIITMPNPRKFGPREIQEELNIWIEPYAEGLTPMKQAFELCVNHLEEWAADNENSFPPIVFNITDGEASDVDDYSELVEAADKIKKISTTDGNTLLFNLLLSDDSASLKEFPMLSDRVLFENAKYEEALFDASSVIPYNLKKLIQKNGEPDEDIKGVVLNGNIESIIRFLNIGTYTLKNNI